MQFLNLIIVLSIVKKGKGKGHPGTGHGDPEGE